MNRLVKAFALYPAVFLCIFLSAVAERADETILNSGNKIPVGRFLTDGGLIDLEALRQSGYQGNLDLDGFDVRLDPESGAPLVTAATGERDPDDQYWHDLTVPDSGMNSFMSSSIRALTVYDNNLRRLST